MREMFEGRVISVHDRHRMGFVKVDKTDQTLFFHFDGGRSYYLHQQERPRWCQKAPYRDPRIGDRIRFRIQLRKRDGRLSAFPWGLQEEFDYVVQMAPRLDLAA